MELIVGPSLPKPRLRIFDQSWFCAAMRVLALYLKLFKDRLPDACTLVPGSLFRLEVYYVEMRRPGEV